MLDAWYFAVCVQVPPTQMASFLGVIDTLSAADSDAQQLNAALEQVSAAEPILRHYAVPHLIAIGLRDDDVALETGAAARRAFVDALGAVEQVITKSLLSAWDGLIQRGNDDEQVLARLRGVFDLTSSRWATLDAESVPYFGVDDYVAEIAVLAVLARAVPSRPSLARGLLADEKLARLLALGLAGRFGRLGLLVSFEVAALVGDHVSEVALIDTARSLWGTGSPWELDVLATFARTQFGYPGRTAGTRSPSETVAAIALETATFGVWDAAFGNDPQPSAADAAATARLGLAGRPDIGTAMVLWQTVLWELACEFDPIAAAREIDSAWLPPDSSYQSEVKVAVPLRPQQIPAWRRRVDSLAALRGAGVRLGAKSASTAQLSPRFHGAVTSPWMTFATSHPYAIPRVSDSLALLRLLSSSLTAIRLIRAVGSDDQAPLLPFLLHVQSIITGAPHKMVKNIAQGREDENPSMVPALLGLAATVYRSLRHLGSGRYEHVHPARFAQFVTVPEERPSRSTESLRTRSGMTFVEWLREAMSGSLPGEHAGQARWHDGPAGRTLAEDVLRAGTTSSDVWAVRGSLSLLVGFFDPDFPRAPEIAWFNQRSNPKGVAYSEALAAPLLDLDGWREKDVQALTATNGLPARIALETLRLEALFRSGLDRHPDLEVWVQDWHRLMDAVDEPLHLPRELRAAMLRLLDTLAGGTETEYEVLEHLLDTEVEFGWGTPFDRWMIFRLLGRETKLPEETARRLRQRLLVALYHDGRDRVAAATFSDPWRALDIQKNQEILERLLQRFIADIGQAESHLHDRGLAHHLESLWLSSHRGSALRELQFGRRGGQLDRLDRRLLVGAASDIRVDDLRVHLRPAVAVGKAGVVDAFTESVADAADRVAAGSSLLGIVAARQAGRAWVNVWLGGLLKITPSDDRATRVGDLVELRAHGSPIGIVAERGGSIREVAVAPVVGAVRDAVLAIDYDLDPTRLTLRVDGEAPVDLDDLDEVLRGHWMPDMVGLLTRTAPVANDALAVWNGKHWAPAEMGMPELLASLQRDTVRLVVVAIRDGRMLASPRPGQLVWIPDGAWDEADLARIVAEVLSGANVRGLVLAVRAAGDADGAPRLRLDGDGCAIDNRAVRWAATFDDDGDYEPQQDEAGRPVWDTGIEGLPLVRVDGLRSAVAAFRPSIWREREQRSAMVRAEAVKTSSLNVGERTIEALRAVLNVAQGSQSSLDEAFGTARWGTMSGKLANGMRVEVEAESLSFGERRPGDRLRRLRRVEVTNVSVRESPIRRARASGIRDSDLLNGADPEWREDVELALSRQRVLHGVVVTAPTTRTDGSVYEVWFDLGQAVSVVDVRMDMFELVPRSMGDLVTATAGRDGWSLAGLQRRIRVRALWTLAERAPRKNGLVLGAVPWEGELRTVVQDTDAAILYLVPSTADYSHLSLMDARGRVRRGVDVERGRIEGTPLKATCGGRSFWRTVQHVLVQGREVDIAGEVINNRPDPDGVLEATDLLLESAGEGRYGLRRLFTVSRSVRAVEPLQEPERDGWPAYVADPQVLDAEFVGRSTVRLRTSFSVLVDGTLTKDIPLAANEETWVDAGGAYSRNSVRVLLTMEDGRIVATYRRAPMLDLAGAVEEWRRQGVPIGERHPLRQRLHYVDRQETAEGVSHRFEWGFGWICSIPESQITIGGQAAPKWAIVPFHGDVIARLLVRHERASYRIDIDVESIDQGLLSELYADARQGVVSTATFEVGGGGRPKITALRVRDRHRLKLDPSGSYDDGRQVPLRRVRFTDRAVQAIAATGVQPGTRLALVRLMKELFVASGGRVVEFDFVSPRLGGEGALQPHERVFLTVTRALKVGNDVMLELTAIDVIGAPKPLKVSVLRRDFSWREDLLRRLVTDEHGALVPDALKGDVYLVRITRPSEHRVKRESVGGSIVGGLSRPTRVLRSHVSSSEEVCFAVVEVAKDRNGPDVIRLEVRPNVVFSLEAGDYLADGQIANRSIVRVLSRNGRLFLTTALGGDASYVPRAGRPVIVLPMQNLLRSSHSIEQAIEAGRYTVVGLPGLQPGTRGGSDPAFARKLVTTPHPKVASLVLGTDNRWRLEPLETGGFRAASFTFDADGTVSAVFADGSALRAEWDQISFRDAGAAVIRKLSRRSAWTYHDETTSHRSSEAPHAPEAPVKLARRPRHDVDPVFFTDDLRLRYTGEELGRVGFPAREILAGGILSASGPEFVVAGMVRRANSIVGVWIEVSPGHIVELTSSMFAPVAADIMAAIDWTHFAPGDLIRLRSRRATSTELATLILEGWKPGPRKAFGRRALLPVRSTTPETQVIRLGGGAWTLDRPTEPDVELPPDGASMWLGRDKMRLAVEDITVGSLREFDTVLVEMVDGRPSICGLAGAPVEFAAQPGSPDEWIADLLRLGEESLLDLFGGSLPFTVRAVRPEGAAVLDRSQQEGVLRPGTSVPCRPVGLVNGQVVLRAGSRIYRCPASVVFPGLPASLLAEATRALARMKNLIWLVSDSAGILRIGAPAKASAEIRVRPIVTLSDDDARGVLCWDLLHGSAVWLPSDRLGWMQPTESHVRAWAESVLAAQSHSAMVAIRPDGTVSVSDTAAAEHRLQQLRVGETLRIETISEDFEPDGPDRVRYLARLHLTDVLLEFAARSDRPIPGSGPRFGEIEAIDTRRGARPNVRVADTGAREFRAALPSWFVRSAGEEPVVPARFHAYRGAADIVGDDSDGVAVVRAASRLLRGERATTGEALRWLGARGEDLFGLRTAELDLPPALAATLIVAAAGSSSDLGDPFAQAAVLGLRQIGLRSAMSRHLPPLLELWSAGRAGRAGLWRRLDSVAIAPRMTRAEVEKVSRLSAAIRGRTAVAPDAELALFGECLAASIGSHETFDGIAEHPDLLRDLSDLGRALTPRHDELTAQASLIPAQVLDVRDALVRSLAEAPVTLLPVPGSLQDGNADSARVLLASLLTSEEREIRLQDGGSAVTF